ncbi:MAG: hypothetical protein CM1200mP20_08960 [Pseudomonadota bacterium]|nr:MAG: hypothetical protein CM1200mP20_08960 [Pseudomonadota bacterium]
MTGKRKDIQFDAAGNLRHLLTTEGLSAETITEILDTAESFISIGERHIRKVPLLHGRTVVNLFFEPSTRTRTTFEIAAKRLSADVFNLNPTRLSTSKGESILDTVRTLEAMHTDMFVVRDGSSGTAHLIARHVPSHVHIINAGDGATRTPHRPCWICSPFARAKVFPGFASSYCWRHPAFRVARSQIHALNILGAKEVRVSARRRYYRPKSPVWGDARDDLDDGLANIDVIMMLACNSNEWKASSYPVPRSIFGFMD